MNGHSPTTRSAVNRHTLVTELSESGASDEVIMSIAGHVSRAMLSRYSHVRMKAKALLVWLYKELSHITPKLIS